MPAADLFTALETTVAGKLHFAKVRNIVRVEWQERDVLQQIVVARFAHWLPVGHLAQSGIQPVSILVQRFDCGVAPP